MIDYSKLNKRAILCIDMKSFYASVESVRRNIDPLESYIVVVGDFERDGSVILAASPRVKREFGIKTGNRKYEIPHDEKIMLVEPSMDLYIEINRKINEIFSRYTSPNHILPYSIDESFLDVTPSLKCLGKTPKEISFDIQKTIKDELGLVSVVGMGDNPLLAKLALDNSAKKTKDNIAYYSYDNIPDTVWKIPNIRDFWGIGKGYEKRFKDIGINSIYELAHTNKNILKKLFGVVGERYYYFANGVDQTIISEVDRVKDKSISKGQTLFEDYTDIEKIKIIVLETMEILSGKLRRKNMVAGGISLYLGYSYKCNEKSTNCIKKISTPTNNTHILQEKITKLLMEKIKPFPVRKISVGLNRLQSENSANIKQISFFENNNTEKHEKLDKAIDKIREKYGYTSIVHGYSMMEGSTLIERAKKTAGHKAKSNLQTLRFIN